MTLLNVRDMTVTYPTRSGPFTAVREVSFELGRGRTLAIVGESGAGKSTIGQVLLGLQPASAGSVRLDDRELVGLRRREWPAVRRVLQVVFQNPSESLTPGRSVSGLVSEPLRRLTHTAREAIPERVRRMLKAVQLPPDYASRRVDTLSGGQAQRVAIARALIVDPKLVILDEPTASLDMSVRREILLLLQHLQRERGISFVLITHDLASVHVLAHDVLVLYGGRTVEHAPVEEVVTRPRHPYSRALIGAFSGTEALTLGDGLTPPAHGCPLTSRCPFARPSCARLETLQRIAPEHLVRCDVPEALDVVRPHP